MKTRSVLCLCLVTLALAPAGRDLAAEVRPDTQSVVNGNNAFALDLYAELKSADGNLFFSPFSISTALAMTYAGARGNTADQMAKALHFTLGHDRLHPAIGAILKDLHADKKLRRYQLDAASALWVQKGYVFLPEFLQLAAKNYGAAAKEVNFADTEPTRTLINDWTRQQTQDKIKDLVNQGDLKRTSLLVLTDAIYFSGDWIYKFELGKTKETPFTLLSARLARATMMQQVGDFNAATTDAFILLELPYGKRDLSMLILLPKKLNGLPGIEKSLTPDVLAEAIAGMTKRMVSIILPKFAVASELELTDALKALGMTDAFGRADFSGIDGSRLLTISRIRHKAIIDVHEKGTEAAAATAVVTEMGAAAMINFRADHPFLFIIRDNRTGLFLFIGRVMDPR